jgi:hypothetical protein
MALVGMMERPRGTFSHILQKEKFKALDSGSFWLSEHPEKPGYRWDTTINRICSWLKLERSYPERVISMLKNLSPFSFSKMKLYNFL